jgi:hypothetical protein
MPVSVTVISMWPSVRPNRASTRPPSFVNLTALGQQVPDHLLHAIGIAEDDACPDHRRRPVKRSVSLQRWAG